MDHGHWCAREGTSGLTAVGWSMESPSLCVNEKLVDRPPKISNHWDNLFSVRWNFKHTQL